MEHTRSRKHARVRAAATPEALLALIGALLFVAIVYGATTAPSARSAAVVDSVADDVAFDAMCGRCSRRQRAPTMRRVVPPGADGGRPQFAFRVAVVSDQHYGEAASNANDRWSSQLQYAAFRRNRVDFVVYNGDQMSQFDHFADAAPQPQPPADNAAAAECSKDTPPLDEGCFGPHRDAWPCWRDAVAPAAAMDIPFASVVGNHDEGANKAAAELVGLERAAFGDHSCSCGAASYEVAVHLPPHVERKLVDDHAAPLQLLFLNSISTEADSQIYSGYRYPDRHQVAATRRRLEARRRTATAAATVAFVHVPPALFMEEERAMRRGWRNESVCCQPSEMPQNRALSAMLLGTAGGNAGVDAVVSGHDHKNDFWGYVRRPTEQRDTGRFARSGDRAAEADASALPDDATPVDSARFLSVAYTRKSGFGGYLGAAPPGIRIVDFTVQLLSSFDRQAGATHDVMFTREVCLDAAPFGVAAVADHDRCELAGVAAGHGTRCVVVARSWIDEGAVGTAGGCEALSLTRVVQRRLTGERRRHLSAAAPQTECCGIVDYTVQLDVVVLLLFLAAIGAARATRWRR
jgi:hypothetical protein